MVESCFRTASLEEHCRSAVSIPWQYSTCMLNIEHWILNIEDWILFPDLLPSAHLQHLQNVLTHVVQGGVPEAAGDAEHLDVRGGQRHHDGLRVVDPAVRVDQQQHGHPVSSSWALRCCFIPSQTHYHSHKHACLARREMTRGCPIVTLTRSGKVKSIIN